jgi:hypothetical protein
VNFRRHSIATRQDDINVARPRMSGPYSSLRSGRSPMSGPSPQLPPRKGQIFVRNGPGIWNFRPVRVRTGIRLSYVLSGVLCNSAEEIRLRRKQLRECFGSLAHGPSRRSAEFEIRSYIKKPCDSAEEIRLHRKQLRAYAQPMSVPYPICNSV